MTPAKKWRALSNPQSVADYGVTMTLQEILQVPAAVAEVNKYIPLPLTIPPAYDGIRLRNNHHKE